MVMDESKSFWGIAQCSSIGIPDVSEVRTAFIIRVMEHDHPDNGDSTHL
jgi:hypothetical protein